MCLWLVMLFSVVVSLVVTEINTVTIYFVPGVGSQTQLSQNFEPTTTEVANSAPQIDYSGPFVFNNTFAEIMVLQHNQKRTLHHSQPLQWNNTLFEFAAQYTEAYDCSGILKHSGGIYGENLALGYSSSGAVNAWYKEGESYDYNTHNSYTHFTAMMWNSTTQLGCAYKYCNSVWNDYTVCSYYPAGNVVGQNEGNVFPV